MTRHDKVKKLLEESRELGAKPGYSEARVGALSRAVDELAAWVAESNDAASVELERYRSGHYDSLRADRADAATLVEVLQRQLKRRDAELESAREELERLRRRNAAKAAGGTDG